MAQIIKADLDEMVFEDREHRYGGYFLRKRYPRYLSVGVVIISFLALLFTFAPILARTLGMANDEDKVRTMAVTISMENLPPPPPVDEEAPPPPPPPRIPPPQIKTVAFKIPEPTPEEELTEEEEEQTIAEVEELKDAPNIGLEDKEGADEGFFEGLDGDGDIPEVIVEQEPNINEFIFAEEEPAPINMDAIRDAIGYPQIARDAGIEGSVVIRVLVGKKGEYIRHKVINKTHPILVKAVEAQVHKLRFTPAIQGGRPINFWVNIPFSFKLLD